MGLTRHLLSTRAVASMPRFYTNLLRIDLAENLHVHLRDHRWMFSLGEWKRFVWAVLRAELVRRLAGFGYRHPSKAVYLAKATLPEPDGMAWESLRLMECSVELQEQADYIHVHYRAWRLELTYEEFDRFAATMAEARAKLLKGREYSECPRRVGFEHGTNPRGRVEGKNPLEFSVDLEHWDVSLVKQGLTWRTQMEGQTRLPQTPLNWWQRGVLWLLARGR